MRTLLKIGATGAVLAILAHVLFTVFNILVYGQYWVTAPVFMTAFIAVCIPVGSVYGAYHALRFLWGKKQ